MEISTSLISLFILYLYFVSKNMVEASHDVFTQLQSKPAVDAKRAGRTGYHFQPAKNWINDPNGPMYYKAYYHLFYQYNPKGAVWGNIVWAHSVSTDLINWQKLENAIVPSTPSDKYGCWSGSTTIIGNKYPIILYTGIIDRNNTQVQNYAIPADRSDPYLRKWVKPANNTVIKADNFVNKTSFRDPTTAWFGPDRLWRISLGGRFNDMGIVHLYQSRDFKHWTKADHYLHSVEGTGNFECPDFYPVLVNGTNGLDTSVNVTGVKHVLKVSLDATRYEYYTIGTYDLKTDKYLPDQGMIDGRNGLRYDYGNFYASKSFYDPSKRRRILWGWANESDSTADDIAKGWAGIQLIPRTILLDPNGLQLRLWPVQEVESLRGKVVDLSNMMLTTGERIEINGITPAQADVEVTFSFNSLDKAEIFDPSWDRYDAQRVCSQKGATVQGGLGPFGLFTLASKNLTEYTPVFFRVFRDGATYRVLMCSDASRSTLENGLGAYRPSFAGFVNADLGSKKLSLRSLIDNSVVESFGAEGRTCISSRVYPTLAIQSNAHLYAFNNGIEDVKIDCLKAWSMNSPRNMNQ